MLINLTFDASTSAAPAGFIAAMNYVAKVFDALIANPITVNITVGWGSINGAALSAGALGESEYGYYTNSYATIRSLIASSATSTLDQTALANLPGADPTNGATFEVTTAQMKALGVSSFGGVDGYVGFNSSANWNFDTTSPAVQGAYSFVGVAEHEISEVLGRYSAIPYGDYSILDLFRWSSAGVRSTPASPAGYFSVDGSAASLVPADQFNGTASQGDLGDWAVNSATTNDAFDYSGSPGHAGKISPTDVSAMDAIGYSVASPISSAQLVINTINFTSSTSVSIIGLLSSGVGLQSVALATVGGSPATLSLNTLNQISTSFSYAGNLANGTYSAAALALTATDLIDNAHSYSLGFGLTINSAGVTTLSPGSSSSPFVNKGLVEESGTSGLVVSGGVVDQTQGPGGTIEANGGQTSVTIQNSIIKGGQIVATDVGGAGPGALVTVAAGTMLDGAGLGMTLVAAGDAQIVVQSGVTFLGTVSTSISAGATASFSSTYNGSVTFSGAGKLVLAQSSYSGGISGFGAGDILDLKGLNAAGYSRLTVRWTASATLEIDGVAANGSLTKLSTLSFAQPLANTAVWLGSDGQGGMELVDAMQTSYTIATYLPNKSALDAQVGGFAISDTTATIAANLAALQADSNITKITTSDGGKVVVSASAFAANEAALDLLANGYTVVDSVANIVANNAQIAADTRTFGLTVRDTAANIAANFSTLFGYGFIGSIVVSDNATLGLSAGVAAVYASLLSKVHNANGSAAVTNVVDTASNISSYLSGLPGSTLSAIVVSDNGPISVVRSLLTFDAPQIAKLQNADATPIRLEILNSDGTYDITSKAPDTFFGTSYASYDAHYTSSNFEDTLTVYDASGNTLGIETFTANGSYSATVGGVLKQTQTVNAGGDRDVRTYTPGTVAGISYASYDLHYTSSNFQDKETWYNASGMAVLGAGQTANGAYDYHYYTSGTFYGVAYASYDNHYNSSNFRDLLTVYDSSGNVLGTESFNANGGYVVSLGGSLVQSLTVNADGGQDYRYYTSGTAGGAAFASYDIHYTASAFHDLTTYYDASGNPTFAYGMQANGGYDFHYYNVLGTLGGVSYTNYDNHYNSSNFRDLLTVYDSSGNVLGTASFTANGGYAITLGGAPFQSLIVGADGSQDYHYYTSGTAGGTAFASYDVHYTASAFHDLTTYYDASGNPVFAYGVQANGGYDFHYYNVLGTLGGVSYTNYDNHYNSSNFRDLLTVYDSSGNVLGTDAFTSNGGFTLTIGGVVVNQQKYNADGSFSLYYGNVAGQSYTSYQNDYNAAGTRIAGAFDNTDGSGTTWLFASNLTVASGGGAESLTFGVDTFNYQPHATEIFNAYGVTNETFAFSQGFGAATINGWDATDFIHFGTLFSSYAQIQGAMTTSNGNTIISDGKGDTLTIAGVTPSQMNAARFGY